MNGSEGAALRRRLDQLRTGFWFIPGLFVLGAVGAAIGLIAIDRRAQESLAAPWLYEGGPANASDTLTTIASSMITFTALVFSITMVALQLTSSQFSPRVVGNFLRDRQAQVALGVFVATFAYAFTALSAVRVAAEDDPGFVPTITVTGSLLLVAASVVAFVQLIHHMSRSLQVSTIIDRVAQDTRRAIDRAFPADATDPPPSPPGGTPRVTIPAPEAGVVTDVDLEGLARSAAPLGVVVTVPHHVGTFVCRGMPLLHVHPADGPDPGALDGTADAAGPSDDDASSWTRYVFLEGERTMVQDPMFGLRQLVDIAERALSPGVNDPTTAIQCIDRIHDLLRTLAVRPMWRWRTAGADGDIPRAYEAGPDFTDALDLAVDEIRHWGSDSPRVHRRLRELLDDLAVATPDPSRRAAVEVQRRRLDARRRDLPTVERP